MFEAVLKMSLYGSAAALLVMLLRLIPKLPPRIKFVLWGFVFLRLIVPPGVFMLHSPVSLQAVVPGEAIVAVMPAPPAQQGVNAQPPTQAPMDAGVPDGNPEAVPQPPFDWMGLLEKAWFVGFSVCAALMIATYLRVSRREKFETAAKGVYASDRFASPAVVGIWRPKIVLPMYIHPEEAQDIILHERTHIRRGDHITKLLLAFIAAVHWFNLLVWFAYALAVRDMEMAVDEAVLRKSSADIRAQYATSLLNVAQERMLAFPGFGESDIKRRVKGILYFKKPSRWIAALSAALVIAAGIFLLTGGAPAMSEQPQEPLYAFKSRYVGDNSNTVELLRALPYGSALVKTELLTQSEPYGIVATYDFTKYNSLPEAYLLAWEDAAATIFALIGNVGEIQFNSGMNTYYFAERADFERMFGQDLREYAKDEDTFSAFLNKLQTQPTPGPTTLPDDRLSFKSLGEGNLLLDFTMHIPADSTANISYKFATITTGGEYAGSVELRAYYPEEDYGQLTDNHTSRTSDFEEANIDFADNGLWRTHLQKVVAGYFNSDDRDDPLSGKTYDHTTYYLIFENPEPSENEEFDYQLCYALDFVTAYKENGQSREFQSEADILAQVESFALKSEWPYVPKMDFKDMELMAADRLADALYEGKTAESILMYREMGNPHPITLSDLSGAYEQVVTAGNELVWAFGFEKGGILASLQINMATGKVSYVAFSRILYETIPSLKRDGYNGTRLTFIDGIYDPDKDKVGDGQGVQPKLTPREAADIALRALYDMTGYQVGNCFVQTESYSSLFADFKFSHVDSNKLYDYFCTFMIDTQTGRIVNIFLNFYKDPQRHPFQAEDFVKPDNFDSMDYGQIARYYYENSSYGDRRPIVHTEPSKLVGSGHMINLVLSTGEFYEVTFDEESRLPQNIYGPYPEGFTH